MILLAAALSVVNIQAAPKLEDAETKLFTLCPADVQTSSVALLLPGSQLRVKLSDAAADRLLSATEDKVGSQLVLVESIS